MYEEEKKLDSELDEKEKISALAAALKLDEKRVAGLIGFEKGILNTQNTQNTEEQEDFSPEKTENAADEMLSKQVGEMLSSLSEMEARVISMRFGIGGKGELSYEEIAEKLGITAEEVSELEKQAMLHLGR